jgi:DNA-binding MarR family transcriptional regulator
MFANIDTEYDKKKKILKDIILKEEDALAQLQRIVKLAKPFLRIEENTGRVVLTNFALTNSEKIFLFLLGKYLAYHSGIAKESTTKMRDISDALGVAVTTLSAPLGRLVRDHIVDRPQKDTYQVNPHKIETTLKEISQKYSDTRIDKWNSYEK